MSTTRRIIRKLGKIEFKVGAAALACLAATVCLVAFSISDFNKHNIGTSSPEHKKELDIGFLILLMYAFPPFIMFKTFVDDWWQKTDENRPNDVWWRYIPNIANEDNVLHLSHIVLPPATGLLENRNHLLPADEKNEIPSVHSQTLNIFIKGRRKVTKPNQVLSSEYKYDAEKLSLACSISHGFPNIPVRFNGHLYDFDNLMRCAQNGYIKDPLNRNVIKLDPHVIQPDFEAQTRMDKLLREASQQHRAEPVVSASTLPRRRSF